MLAYLEGSVGMVDLLGAMWAHLVAMLAYVAHLGGYVAPS